MRRLILLTVAASCLTSLLGSTLQRLSLSDMIQKATIIVRGTIQPGTSAALRGPLIYTHYQLSVTTTLKGAPGQTPVQNIDVAVPGGALNGIQQPVAGAPTLNPGQDYVFFLWTSKSGLTQVIGLSQGLFAVTQNSAGAAVIVRPASISMMLNQSGQVVTDQPVSMTLTALRSEIQSVLGAGN